MLYMSAPVASAVLCYMQYIMDSNAAIMTHQYINGRETGFQVVTMVCSDSRATRGWQARSIIVAYDSRYDKIILYMFDGHSNRPSLNVCPRYDDTKTATGSRTFACENAHEAAEAAIEYLLYKPE
jgi:hypothetical protein